MTLLCHNKDDVIIQHNGVGHEVWGWGGTAWGLCMRVHGRHSMCGILAMSNVAVVLVCM